MQTTKQQAMTLGMQVRTKFLAQFETRISNLAKNPTVSLNV
jgi:hypothetical protein